MPRAFLIKKKHSTTKRKINVDDEEFSVHEPRDYSKKDSVASDSGNESCSPANSPSPQHHSYYHRHPFHPDDIPPPPPAATALIARTALDIYGRPTVLEPVNINASMSNFSGWMKPYLPSYLQFGCSPFQSQHGFVYGYPSVEPFINVPRSISPTTPTEEPSETDGSKCLDLTSNTLMRKPTVVSKKLSEGDFIKEPKGTTHWTELTQDIKMHDVEHYHTKPCSTSGRRRGTDGPRYNCPDCNKSYSTYSGLSKHQQFHCSTNNKKSFSCKYCEKIYVSLGALKMHIRTHTLPCKCKLCGKAFSRPWLLQGHIRTHTGEKPFTCPHCNRAFADRSNLRAHLQTHSDIKKYSCKNCAKTFSRMSLLLKHEDGGCGHCGATGLTMSPMQERLGP